MSSNLPPGVSEHMIPGNRPEDMAEEAFWAELYEKAPSDHLPEEWYDDADGIVKLVTIARDMGYQRGYNEGQAEAEIALAAKYEESELSFRAEQENMREAHAEGLHAGHPREFCPECQASRKA